MSAPGGFSSFPERPRPSAAISTATAEAGPSMPSFSSFPTRPSPREGSRQEQRENHETRRRHREGKDSGRRNDDEYSSRARDGERRRRRSRSREPDRPRSRNTDRHESRHKEAREEGSHRYKDDDAGERHYKHHHHPSKYEDESEEDRHRRKRDRDGRRTGEFEEKIRSHRDRQDDRRDSRASVVPARPPAPTEWFIDTAGDPDVLRYGSIDPRKIVKHNVFGYGTVLGLPENHRIQRSDDRERGGYGSGVVIEMRGPGGRVQNQNHQQNAEQRGLGTSSAYQRAQVANKAMEQNKLALADPVKLVVPPRGTESKAMNGQADFIGLTESKSGGRPSIEDIRMSGAGHVSSDVEVQDSDMDASEKELERDDDVPGESETLEESLRRRTREFEIRLTKDPTDVNGWIAYSALQLSRPDKVFSAKASASDVDGARRGETEVAMSILEKAFQRHPANETSIVMQRAYLKLAQNIWPVSKVTQRYRGVLKMLEDKAESADEGQRMDFWLEYIEWREGRGLGSIGSRGVSDIAGSDSGGVDDLIAVYVECMQTMQQSMRNHPSRQEEIEANLVYLQLRLMSVLRQSGYEERATAILQLMLELTFFKPDDLRRAHTTGRALHAWQELLLKSLESFWDSEVPRIGEDAATGWRAWQTEALLNEAADNTKPSEPTEPLAIELDNGFTNWYAAEIRAGKDGARPARASDVNVDEDDPFRVILFGDIQDCVFVIQTGEVKLQLVYAALAYLGLAIQPAETGSNAKLAIDPHMATDIHPAIKTFWPGSGVSAGPLPGAASDGVNGSDRSAPFGCPVMCWLTDSNSAFKERNAWFSSPTLTQVMAVDAAFCRNFFSQLRPVVSDPTFRSAQLAFEAALSARAAGKLAKMMLMNDRTNLQLYADYARILRSQGTLAKEVESINVYCQALRGSEQVELEGQEDRARLFADFAELEWIRGRGRRCLAVLCSAASQLDVAALASLADLEHQGPILSVTCILQTGKHYRSLPSTSPGSALLMTTLFEYFGPSMGQPTDDSTAPALSHLTHIISGQLEASSPLCEAAYQLGSRLLYLHRKQQAFMTGGELKLSEWLEQAIRAFPNNTAFLSLLLAMESGAGSGSGRIFGRLQRLLNEVVLVEGGSSATRVGAEQNVVGPRTWAWAAWAEAQLVGKEGFWSSKTGKGVGIGAAGLERVRKVLEMGVSSIAGKHCLPLWLLYIDFEISQSREKTAKTLCYRAVARLGGCKDLYLLAFSPPLRDHFTPQELNSWADLMLERGIRVRVPTERYWTAAQIEEIGMFDRLEDGMLEIEAGEPEVEENDPYAKVRQERTMLPM